MRILLCHNQYQQPGGEDLSFAAEAALLEKHGHEVIRHLVHNDAIDDMSRLRVAARTMWSRQSYREIRDVIRKNRPDVMHCTNTFPLLSPSIYYAARKQGVGVVQSLRNFRLLCPSSLLLRNDSVCEDCLSKLLAWPGIVHGCYRNSRAGTAVVAGMSTFHRLLGTWRNAVDLYFTPSEFARQVFLRAGFPADKIAVKPNFIDPDPGEGDGAGGEALFVGRLSPEKGIETLLQAWRQMPEAPVLKIIGDGPLADVVSKAARELANVAWLGARSHENVMDLLGNARFLVMPSICYETFGRTVIEAFAKGTPVVASRLGSMQELVEPGINGLQFEAGSADGLAETVKAALRQPKTFFAMRRSARETYRERFTGEVNYEQLVSLYERASPQAAQALHQCVRLTPPNSLSQTVKLIP